MASSTIASRIVIFSAILKSFLCGTCLAYSCYFPDGVVADSYVACSPNGDGSCCLKSDLCTSLGYCLSQSKGYHYRGACTDSTWFNPSCPDYCLADSNSGNSSAVNVIACNAAQNGGSWCCAYNGNCCSSSTFVPGWGTLFAEGATPSTSAAIQTVTVSILTSPYSTSTATSTTNYSMPEASDISGLASNSTTTTIAVGIAVGVSLGLAVVVSLVLYRKERRRRIKIERDAAISQRGVIEHQELPNNVYTKKHELPSNRRHELGA